MPQEIHLSGNMHPDLIEAGCDEAGRGPLAGPVFAAAVILPPDFTHPLLNDSKQMSEKSRDILREVIEREAVAWAVENGITTGVGNGRFDPTGACTRAQIAAFLARSMK